MTGIVVKLQFINLNLKRKCVGIRSVMHVLLLNAFRICLYMISVIDLKFTLMNQ